MPKFAVQYALPTGKTGIEVIEAASERAAASQIEASGRVPITVRADRGKAGRGPKRLPKMKGGKALRRAVLDFTHQLAAITESGIPVIAGLKAVGEQTEHPALRGAVARMVARIEGGRALAEAMEAEADIFSPLYVKTLTAGEAAGKVPEVLHAIGRYQEQDAETRAQVRSAMLYPALVVVALVMATVFLLIFVVPQFVVLFEKFQGELPLPTRILMRVSDLIMHQTLIVVAVLAIAVHGLKTTFRYPGPRAWFDRSILRTPVFGKLLQAIYMIRFVELLSLLNRSALPITQSLRVTADSMTNDAIRKDIRGMIRDVEGGRTLGEAFSATTYMTPLVKRMLAIGEQSGRTDQILEYIAHYYVSQTQRGVKMLSTLIEPMLVTGLAAVVLFFALAIFLPMWKMLKLMGTA